MRIRFIIILILSMILVLLSSIVVTYTTLRSSQQVLATELESIKNFMMRGDLDASETMIEIQKRIALYKAFSQRQAIDTTRSVLVVFFMEIGVLFLVFLYFVYGITRPMNRLSAAVQSIYFDRNQKELILEEAGSEEVRVLVRAFNEMLVKLKNYEQILGNVSKYRGWKEISRIIVHEINNIISPALTYVEFLTDKVSEKDREKVLFILSKLNDMRGILGKFREISHLPDASLERQNIIPLLKELGREFPKVRMVSESIEELFLPVDTVLFKEIIRNLIKNAVESGENVQVEIEVVLTGQMTEIKVRDNGKGMTKETISKIFSPGYSTKKGNIGIGLSIVQSLIQEQNAELNVESTPGEGTCFTVQFRV